MKKNQIRMMTLAGLGVALNIVGAFVALHLRLPIYMDSIGTILVACLLGPKYAIMTGLCSSVISGITFDIYSLYFAPVQITTGLFAGWMYEKKMLSGRKCPLGILVIALPTAVIGAVITAYIFGGVTSSGSSYLVQVLMAMGVPDVMSVFVTQVITDYLDEFAGVILVAMAMKAIPEKLRIKIVE